MEYSLYVVAEARVNYNGEELCLIRLRSYKKLTKQLDD